jgi:hypothetical protein
MAKDLSNIIMPENISLSIPVSEVSGIIYFQKREKHFKGADIPHYICELKALT